MQHEHTSKVLEWGFTEKHNFKAVLWGCTECDETSPTPFPSLEVFTDHRNHTRFTEGCFACKLGTLQLSTGDAGRADSMPQKKWDAELSAYRDARAEGIQPAGTSMKAIEEAKQASDNLGRAFNAENMGAAKAMTKQKAKAMNEVGL